MAEVTDRFGAITLPVEIPQGKEPVSDRFLFYALDYFKAFVNAKGARAWNAVQPGQLPIKTTFAHDPEQVAFNTSDLPALFMWRDESGAAGGAFSPASAFEWIAEDYLIANDTVRILWCFPIAEQSIRRIREPILNGLVKAMAVAFEIGRDPSWRVPGDTDGQAATYGSLFVHWAGCMFLAMSRWQRRALVIHTSEGTTKTYETMEARLSLQELMTEDPTRYPAMGAGSLDLQLSDSTNTLLVDERIL